MDQLIEPADRSHVGYMNLRDARDSFRRTKPSPVDTPAISVVIVDDEAPVRGVLARWLTSWGYRIREAVSAMDALEQIKAEPPSILLTDLMMPVHDGVWLTEQVRDRWPYIAVVIASGVDDLRTVETLRGHGAIDYVTKPFGRELVRQALERAKVAAGVVPVVTAPAPAPAVSEGAPVPSPPAPVRAARWQMKLIDRRDTPIGVALIVGAVMIFHRPLQFLFDIASDLELRYHIDLVPALTLFSVVFGFHQYRKHQDAKFMSAVSKEEARRANERAEEMERLVAFGRDLANAVTLDMIRPLLWEYLHSFGASRDSWIVVQSAAGSQLLLGDSTRIEALEAIADRALSSGDLRQAQAEGVVLDNYVCYPMVVANKPIAAMGISAAEMTSMTARRRIGAVAALIAIAVKNAELYRQTQDKGVRDSLTGCYNRGYTLEAIDNELRRAKRTHSPVSILIFDIDHFKQINDKYGHLSGDRAIVEVAQQLQRTVRASDIKCRYGGDEFIVVLPETDLVGAAQVAENLRAAIGRSAVKFRGETLSVTITIGAACSHGEDLNVTALVAHADAALYDAKRKGRNRVGVAPATLPLATER